MTLLRSTIAGLEAECAAHKKQSVDLKQQKCDLERQISVLQTEGSDPMVRMLLLL